MRTGKYVHTADLEEVADELTKGLFNGRAIRQVVTEIIWETPAADVVPRELSDDERTV